MNFIVTEVGEVEIHKVKSTIKWVINKFLDHRCKKGERIKSPTFTTKCANIDLNWQLHLYLNLQKSEQNFAAINLEFCNDIEIEAGFRIYIHNDNKDEMDIYVSRKRIYSPSANIEHSRFIKENSMRTVTGLLDDSLIIFCEITIEPRSEHNKNLIYNKKINTLEYRRLKEFDDFENLLDDNRFSDVSFTVEGKVFCAHKNILCNKSPVFVAMFQHNMKETEENRVEIEDINCDVFQEMLRYIYTGKVNNIEDMALYLIAAADKYSLKGLTELCEETLCNNLSVDNALEFFNVAELHNAVTLKSKAIECVASNLNKLKEKPGFKTTNVMFEVINVFALKEKKRKRNK